MPGFMAASLSLQSKSKVYVSESLSICASEHPFEFTDAPAEVPEHKSFAFIMPSPSSSPLHIKSAPLQSLSMPSPQTSVTPGFMLTLLSLQSTSLVYVSESISICESAQPVESTCCPAGVFGHTSFVFIMPSPSASFVRVFPGGELDQGESPLVLWVYCATNQYCVFGCNPEIVLSITVFSSSARQLLPTRQYTGPV